MQLQNIIKQIIEGNGAKTKKLRIYDLDNTLITSKSVTRVYNSLTGKRFTLNPSEFAGYVEKPGDIFDFSMFNKIVNGKIIRKQFETFAKALNMGGANKTVILTARQETARAAIEKFMARHGVHNVEIITLGDGRFEAKADWIKKQIIEYGYNDILFVDDAIGYINAIKELAKIFPGVKIKTKLVRI